MDGRSYREARVGQASLRMRIGWRRAGQMNAVNPNYSGRYADRCAFSFRLKCLQQNGGSPIGENRGC